MKPERRAVELARAILAALDQPEPANDVEIDEAALLDRARKDADRMRRARNR